MAKVQKLQEPPPVNAVPEGADVLVGAWVPIPLDTIFDRLDRELRLRESALLAVAQPRASHIETAQFWVYEAQLHEGGTVRRIDLVKRARELGLIENCESPMQHWY